MMMMTKIFHLRTPHFFGCDPLRTVVVFGVHSLAVCVDDDAFNTPSFLSGGSSALKGGAPPKSFLSGLGIIQLRLGSSSIAAGCDVDYSLAKPSLALICN